MDAIDYILDGLEAALALERELGVRAVDFDRTILAPPRPAAPPPPAAPPVPVEPVAPPAPPPPRPAKSVVAPPVEKRDANNKYAFVFLHDRPLVGDGANMIAKITSAMGYTPETAPVVSDGARPDATFYVVLGGRALEKWFPGVKAGPGMWVTGASGEEALVTYSPNYFMRFREITPAVKKIKSDMWKSLQGLLQRLALKK